MGGGPIDIRDSAPPALDWLLDLACKMPEPEKTNAAVFFDQVFVCCHGTPQLSVPLCHQEVTP